MLRVVTLALCSTLLLACSNSKELKPEPLVDMDNLVRIDKVWSKVAGDGPDKRYTLLKPAFAEGRVFAAGTDGKVAAFDAETGKPQWRIKLKKTEISGGVGAFENIITVATYEGDVIALNADNGEELWRQKVSTEVVSAPQPSSEVVVVHTIDGKLHGLSTESGEKLWQYDNNSPVLSFRATSTPIVTRTVAIAGFDNGKLVALNPSNGIGLWDQRIAVPKGSTDLDRVVDIDGSPIMIGDLIFAASMQGRLMAISRSTGRPIWARDLSTHQGLSSNGSAVFVTEEKDAVTAYEFGTGEDVWRNEQMLRRKLTGPAYLRGYVLVADDEGYLHVLNPETGDYLGRRKIDGSGVTSPLVVMGDKVLVLDNDGTLHAVTVSDLG